VNAFPRRLVAALCAVVLAAGGLATAAAPASATVSTLCVGYTACAKAGMSDAGYSKVSKTMYWRMYSGHNCTNYAAYRMVRSGLPNSRPWSGGGNATNWGSAMKSITNGTPRVGSVAWWKAGVYPAGSSGHVAYVERVVSANEIVVSMDSWNGDFSWARFTRATRGWPSGFVHFKDVQITNTALPKVTGPAKVGSTLTASAGTWSVAGAAYAYQWMANGAPISGATASTIALTNPLKGKQLSVRVIASRLGYPNTAASSAATAAVQPGVITNTAAPTITGDPRVDSTLTAHPGSWNPSPTALSYQWQADGTPLSGAATPTLALDPSMVGKAIRVEITAARTGYTSVKALSAATDPVAPGVLRTSAAPTLVGQAGPGRTLRLGSPAVDRHATKRVQWMRGYARVPGATAATYRITAADLGHPIRALVVVNRPGYKQLVLHTPWTRVIRTTPILRVTAHPGQKRLSFRATARASGVRALNGVIQVRARGKLVRQVRLVHGVVSATLTGLRPGIRTYKFRLARTAISESEMVARRLKIR
jgi:surface antigen